MTHPMDQRVASEVRAEMGRQEITGAELANRLGVGPMYLWRRLKGQVAFTLGELARVAEALNVPVAQLLGEEAKTS